MKWKNKRGLFHWFVVRIKGIVCRKHLGQFLEVLTLCNLMTMVSPMSNFLCMHATYVFYVILLYLQIRGRFKEKRKPPSQPHSPAAENMERHHPIRLRSFR